MLETILDYSLQDLMLFSPEVYFRSLHLYNQTMWPAHLIAALAILALGYLILIKPTTAQREVCVILGLSWALCGYFFHINHYSTINWFAQLYGTLFLLQAIMFFWQAYSNPNTNALKQENSQIYLIGKILFILGGFIYPSLTYFEGKLWQMSEMFALFPAPTLIATTGIALMSQQFPKPLLVIPFIYAIIELLTAHLLGSLTWLIFTGLIIIILVYLRKTNQPT